METTTAMTVFHERQNESLALINRLSLEEIENALAEED